MTAWNWGRRHRGLVLWLTLVGPLLAWMGLIFFLSSRPDLPRPQSNMISMLLTSSAHALEYAVLAILWARALGQRRWRWRLPLALTLTILYSLSDEFHQAFVPGRHADPLDLACDAVGALAGLAAWAWLLQRLGNQTA